MLIAPDLNGMPVLIDAERDDSEDCPGRIAAWHPTLSKVTVVHTFCVCFKRHLDGCYYYYLESSQQV